MTKVSAAVFLDRLRGYRDRAPAPPAGAAGGETREEGGTEKEK